VVGVGLVVRCDVITERVTRLSCSTEEDDRTRSRLPRSAEEKKQKWAAGGLKPEEKQRGDQDIKKKMYLFKQIRVLLNSPGIFEGRQRER
jgi:hypothetical protein